MLCFSFMGNAENITYKIENRFCDCYLDKKMTSDINMFYSHYKDIVRRNFLDEPHPRFYYWDRLYRAQFKGLKENLISSPKRYSDYYHNLFIHDQIVDVMKKYLDECNKHSWLDENHGSAYNLSQRQRELEKDQVRVAEYARICKVAFNDYNFKITRAFVIFYEKCLGKHRNLRTLHDYGMLAYLNNNFDKSMELTSRLLEYAEELNKLDELSSEVYTNLGSFCIEAMSYSKAIDYLTKAIKKDPENKEAYFNRALAYFETGQFDEAIEDYLLSDRGEGVVKSYAIVSEEFSQAFLSSLGEGIIEGLKEFVPNLLNSIHGLHNAAWYAQNHPLEASQRVINASYEVGVCMVDYCKDLDWDKIDDHVTELKNLAERFNQLSETEKGQLLGSLIGKYGIDIFIGTKGCKFIAAYRDLRNANRICNLETMVISQANKEAMAASAMKHAAERQAYLKRIKIHWDRQNKHVPGTHNYMNGRGTITLNSSELEILVKEHVGTGQRVIGEFGEAGFIERVDFGKIIGEYALEVEGGATKYIPTTKGIIKYAKNGLVHVIPSDPYAIIK